jgi:hypothetical protein
MIGKYFKVQRDSDGLSLVIGLRVSKLGVMLKASPSLWYDKQEEVRKYHLIRLGVDHYKQKYALLRVIILFFVFIIGISFDLPKPPSTNGSPS